VITAGTLALFTLLLAACAMASAVNYRDEAGRRSRSASG